MRFPVVASGDVRTPEEMSLARDLGADAVMIGRGAIGRPWIFRELTGGSWPHAAGAKGGHAAAPGHALFLPRVEDQGSCT